MTGRVTQRRAPPGKQMGQIESGQEDPLNKSGPVSASGKW